VCCGIDRIVANRAFIFGRTMGKAILKPRLKTGADKR
jgi:hypothetical protein